MFKVPVVVPILIFAVVYSFLLVKGLTWARRRGLNPKKKDSVTHRRTL